MADVFISYKREDREHAVRVDVALREAGYSTWWDTSLVGGDQWRNEICAALREARVVIALWSRRSAESPWVCAEALDGFTRNILISAMIEPVRLEVPFNIVQAVALDGDNLAERLGAGVRKMLAKSMTVEPAPAPTPVPAPAPQPLPPWPVRARAQLEAIRALGIEHDIGNIGMLKGWEQCTRFIDGVMPHIEALPPCHNVAEVGEALSTLSPLTRVLYRDGDRVVYEVHTMRLLSPLTARTQDIQAIMKRIDTGEIREFEAFIGAEEFEEHPQSFGDPLAWHCRVAPKLRQITPTP